MRFLIILVISFILIACSQEKRIDEKRIERFENLLGNQEAKYLNEIITDFHSYLDSNYNNEPEQNRFAKYLTDFVENYEQLVIEQNTYFRIDSIKLLKYKSSSLFNKFELEYPDSVWQDSTGTYVFYKSYGEPYLTITDQKTSIKISEKEFIEELYQKPNRNYTSLSPFYSSLDSIKENDVLIIDYLDTREAAGKGYPPKVLADDILYFRNDSSDYFAERIFIMGLYDY